MRLDYGEVLRFGCIGVLATLTHFILLTLGVEQLGLPPTPANGLAFCVALLVTFFGQSLWVFRGHGRVGTGHVVKFGLSLCLGLVGNMAIMALATGPLGLPYQAGFVAGLVLVPALSFVVNKFWVFRRQEA